MLGPFEVLDVGDLIRVDSKVRKACLLKPLQLLGLTSLVLLSNVDQAVTELMAEDERSIEF